MMIREVVEADACDHQIERDRRTKNDNSHGLEQDDALRDGKAERTRSNPVESVVKPQ